MIQEIANWIALVAGLLFCGALLALFGAWLFNAWAEIKQRHFSNLVKSTAKLVNDNFNWNDPIPHQVVRDILKSLEQGHVPDVVFSAYLAKRNENQ